MSEELPVIFGISGTILTTEEINFFKDCNPAGYIVFSRNIENKIQLRKLTDSLKEISGKDYTPILIDQEGGRVARLRPPLVREYPTSSYFSKLANEDINHARKLVFQNYFNIGTDLKKFGITVNCAPVADLLVAGAHNIIGDRSFGDSVEKVTILCEAAAYGLWAAGIHPIIKHIPGHGNALCDSHEDLPIIDKELNYLEENDFKVFEQLNHLPVWAMTAHIIYTALDVNNCLTISKSGINYVRNKLGFKNHVLISDDLSMKALKGNIGKNALNSLKAGCNLVLHCNGKMDEMKIIVSNILQFKANKKNFINLKLITDSVKIPKFFLNCL